MLTKRIIFGLILIGTIFYAPWWAVFILAILGAFHFPRYYEVFAFGILFDFLYGITGSIFFGFGIIGLIVSCLIFFGIERAKREIR